MTISNPILGVTGLMGGGNMLTITATTTAPAQTVTLQRITPTGTNITVYWGDGNSDTITDGNTGTTTHQYASADTYTIRITRPDVITYLALQTAGLISGFNSVELLKCPALTSLYLSLTDAGTYAIDSSHIASMALTYLRLSLTTAGTYAIDSSHIAAMPLTYLYLYLNTTTLTTTIARADWDGWPNLDTVRFEAGLSAAKVDAILLGFYDGFASKVVAGGTIDLLGNGNAAPSGVSPGGAECPPTTGYNAAYELVNDSCGISANHWASVTVA